MKLKENNLYIARINNNLIKILILEITETSVLWRNMDVDDPNHRVRDNIGKFRQEDYGTYDILEDIGGYHTFPSTSASISTSDINWELYKVFYTCI
jgi:hypothetical protein